jgi:hypothetical protein
LASGQWKASSIASCVKRPSGLLVRLRCLVPKIARTLSLGIQIVRRRCDQTLPPVRLIGGPHLAEACLEPGLVVAEGGWGVPYRRQILRLGVGVLEQAVDRTADGQQPHSYLRTIESDRYAAGLKKQMPTW